MIEFVSFYNLKSYSCNMHNLTFDNKYTLKENRRIQYDYHPCSSMIQYHTRFKVPSYFVFVRVRSIRNIDRLIISAKNICKIRSEQNIYESIEEQSLVYLNV